MDLPLEALKMVSQAAPTTDGMNHNLIWTPENGFVLSIAANGQFMPIRFDYGDKIDDIKAEIQALIGVPMPEEQKDTPDAGGVPMGKEGSRLSLKDRILRLPNN